MVAASKRTSTPGSDSRHKFWHKKNADARMMHIDKRWNCAGIAIWAHRRGHPTALDVRVDVQWNVFLGLAILQILVYANSTPNNDNIFTEQCNADNVALISGRHGRFGSHCNIQQHLGNIERLPIVRMRLNGTPTGHEINGRHSHSVLQLIVYSSR